MTHDRSYLPTELGRWNALRSQLIDAMGPDFDDQALFDTLDGETDLIEVLQGIMRQARYKLALSKGARVHAKEITERADRLEATAAKMRAICLNAMADADIKKIEAPDFVMSRTRSQPAVMIPDETQVPDEWCRLKREPKEKEIGDALKAGADFEFAHFGNAHETLMVR